MFLADKKRILELETSVKQLRNDMKALQASWDDQRLSIANLKEQAIKAINRLDQRARREEQRKNGDEPTEKPINPMAARLLGR